MERTVERLEEYLPFDFKFKKDNQLAHIRLSVTNGSIKPDDLELQPGQYVAGMILPQGIRHRVILRQAPWSQASRRVAVHELGHALGLTHPGEGGFDPNYTTADTIMSFNVTDQTPWFRPADLERLQEIWKDPVTGSEYAYNIAART